MAHMLERLASRVRSFLIEPLIERRPPVQHPDVASQLQLHLQYRALLAAGAALPELRQVGFKVFSQTDEDGILLYILSVIGATTRTTVELCAGNGMECNTANLIINHGWHGLLVDGDAALVQQGKAFYSQHPNTYVFPPVWVHAWLTRDNVNDVIRRHGFSGEVDVLSIDMDGVDYWIWEAITVIEPRVVVVEYQDILGPERSWTVPYSENFDARDHPMTDGMPNFCGASLPAFVKLAHVKGYRLVGCNRYGYNAFFIRDPLGATELPAVDIRDCFSHPKVRLGMKERFPTVQDAPWLEV